MTGHRKFILSNILRFNYRVSPQKFKGAAQGLQIHRDKMIAEIAAENTTNLSCNRLPFLV